MRCELLGRVLMRSFLVATNCMGWGEGDDRIKLWGGFTSEADAQAWVSEVASGWRFFQSAEVWEIFSYDQTADGGDR